MSISSKALLGSFLLLSPLSLAIAATTGLELGDQASAQAAHSIAFGDRSYASDNGTIAIGEHARATMVDGVSAKAAIAIGQNSLSNKQGAIALGANTHTMIDDSIAMGSGAIAEVGRGSVAIGQGSRAIGAVLRNAGAATAIGNNTQAIGGGAIAIGIDKAEISQVNGYGAIGIGKSAMSNGQNSIAIGQAAKSGTSDTSLKNVGSTAIGSLSDAQYQFSTAIGYAAKGGAKAATALGASATAKGEESTALGRNAQALGEKSVALGAGSVADLFSKNSVSFFSNQSNNDMTQGVVSVGSKGNERRIMHVSGAVNDTDAVNLGQLKVVNAKVTDLENSVAFLEKNPGTLSPEVLAQIEKASQDVKALTEKNTDILGGYTELKDSSGKQALAISEHSSEIKDLKTNAQTTTKQVESNTAQIKENSQQIDSNTQNITANNASIADLQQSMGSLIPSIDSRFDNVNQRVDRLEHQVSENRKRADAGVASAIAIASLPQPTAVGKTSVGMAMGYNGGQSALSMGAVHNFFEGKASVKVATTYNTQDKAAAGVGLGWTFN